MCKLLAERVLRVRHSVSFTTRRPRPGEVDGRDYRFVDEKEFAKMSENGEFAEWALVHEKYYGTSKKSLDEMTGQGIDVILDIDVQGAKKLKNAYSEGVYIFVLPPSMGVLKKRLLERMSNSDDEIRERLDTAMEEIKEYVLYDYVIINEVLEDAFRELEAIVVATRLRARVIEPSWVERNFLKEGN